MKRQVSDTATAGSGGWRRRGALGGLSALGALAAGAGGAAVVIARGATAQGVEPATAGPGGGVEGAVEGAVGPEVANALRVPPLLSPPPRAGVRTFALTLQRGQVAFEPGRTVDTLGINGPYLGPTLRAAQGDTVAFAIANRIGEPTTLHWHGMLLPAAMDGGPHQIIEDGATWEPRFAITQQAATLWLHSHMLGRSEAQVTRGLAALFILDDDNPAQTALPRTYGVDDVPLILQEYGFGGGRGGQGAGTLVNGALEPVLATAQPRLRLRLLNASSQRTYALGLSGDVPFHQVASDGGLLPAPVPLTRLQLGPAERAEIVVDLTGVPDGAPLAVQQLGGPGRGGNAGAPGATLLTITPRRDGAGPRTAPAPLPARLNTIERLDPAAAAVTREIVLGGGGRAGLTINGHAMATAAHMHDAAGTLRVRLGDLERWNVVNTTRDTHLFHVHDVQFQILDRNGAPPGPAESGRKDTVLLRPGETVPLLMRFVDFADAETPYMFHCHILRHEDQGMMGQFVVVPA